MFQSSEVARDQCLLLFTAPALELSFPFHSLSFRAKCLRIDQTGGAVLECVGGAPSLVVRLRSGIDVLCRAYVETAVGTAEDVDIVHHAPRKQVCSLLARAKPKGHEQAFTPVEKQGTNSPSTRSRGSLARDTIRLGNR
jgi:hypothetical protein